MRVSASAVIAAPAERLFWSSQDYDRRLDWDPYLCEARLLDGAREPGVGVVSYCRNRRGAGLESRYVAFRPPTHTRDRDDARAVDLGFLLEPIVARVHERDMARRLAAFKRWSESC